MGRRLSPQSGYLGQGDGAARSSLASVLDLHLSEGVHLPENGGVYTVETAVFADHRRPYLYHIAEEATEEAVAVEPEGATLLKTPALRMEQREVALEVAVPEALTAAWERLAGKAETQFHETTGYTLRLIQPNEKRAPPPAEATEAAWEINRAYAEIREAFQAERHAPYRVGLKSDAGGSYIEAAFISPAVGERYRTFMDRLSSRIGWSIRVPDSANQE